MPAEFRHNKQDTTRDNNTDTTTRTFPLAAAGGGDALYNGSALELRHSTNDALNMDETMKGTTINAGGSGYTSGIYVLDSGDNAHITVVAQDNVTTFLHTSVTTPTGNAGSRGYKVNDVLSVQTGAAGAKNSLLAMRVTRIKNTIVGPGASAGATSGGAERAIRSVSVSKTATLANRIANRIAIG